MVIDIINVLRARVKAENHAPVGAHCNGPKALLLAFERMQPESRQVHVVNRGSCVKRRQNITQFARMFRVNSAWVVLLKKPFQSLVANGANHPEM